MRLSNVPTALRRPLPKIGLPRSVRAWCGRRSRAGRSEILTVPGMRADGRWSTIFLGRPRSGAAEVRASSGAVRVGLERTATGRSTRSSPGSPGHPESPTEDATPSRPAAKDDQRRLVTSTSSLPACSLHGFGRLAAPGRAGERPRLSSSLGHRWRRPPDPPPTEPVQACRRSSLAIPGVDADEDLHLLALTNARAAGPRCDVSGKPVANRPSTNHEPDHRCRAADLVSDLDGPPASGAETARQWLRVVGEDPRHGPAPVVAIGAPVIAIGVFPLSGKTTGRKVLTP